MYGYHSDPDEQPAVALLFLLIVLFQHFHTYHIWSFGQHSIPPSTQFLQKCFSFNHFFLQDAEEKNGRRL